MKAVILCGGRGTRLASLSENMPKSLALVKGKPIIWHIMKIYMSYGINEFILPLGFGGDKIKEYFWNYEWKNHDFIMDKVSNSVKILQSEERWKLTFIDTGLETMTGGRIKKIEKYIDEDTFMLTYGDGLSDINLNNLLKFHKDKNKIATLTGIERKSQYGVLDVKDGIATAFEEKSKLDGVINGGFFVLDSRVFDYLHDSEDCIFEREPLMKLADQGELAVYIHKGYWRSVDTYKDLEAVNKTWELRRDEKI
jgi:glucose-1-phosphate cytidylyltransferase